MKFSTRPLIATAVAVAIGCAIAACGGSDAPSSADTTEVRSITLLDKQAWKFIQDDALSEEAALTNDGTAWTSVTLPHTWNSKDAASIIQTTPETKNYKRGRGWYRLEFDNSTSGATKWLQFDGASIVADVWLNGEKLGQHRGAFTEFRFDVTKKLKSGRNVLVVRADNSDAKTSTDVTAIAPLSGDFNMSGGLYRSVSIVSTPAAAHFALNEPVASKDAQGKDVMVDIAGSGIYARTVVVSGGSANVNVVSKLRNGSVVDGNFSVRTTMFNADGKELKSVESAGVAVKAGALMQVDQQLAIAEARLWQGTADPYLHKLVVELRDSGGAVIDKIVQDFGIRTMKFDANNGFYLNDKHVSLRGVNMHQDFQEKGWAIEKADTDLSLDLIKEVGANTIRLAHYPHSTYTYQKTDQMGFVIWAELGYVERTLTEADCKVTTTVPDGFAANAKVQMQELIRQQYNRASIAMWSVGNEVGTRGTCKGVDTVTPLLRELDALSNVEDPSRVTVYADNTEFSPNFDTTVLKNLPPLNTGGITDIWALNRYYGWYQHQNADILALNLQELRAKYPTLPIGISEYGAGAALTHHTDNSYGAPVCFFDVSGRRDVCFQPEEYANRIHEENYKIIDQPYIWGTYVWNMFDFGSGIRHEGDIGGVNTKGLITFDRQTKKDVFFFYKANWSQEPVTHITSRRYTERAFAVTDVTVYSNASSVTLKLNGSAVGTLSAAECVKRICTFKNVKLQAGANSLVAEGAHAGQGVNDTVTWNLAADNASNVYLTTGSMITGIASASGHRYGSDNFFSGGVGAVAVFPAIYGGDPTPIAAGIGVNPADLSLFASYRSSTEPFAYDIPTANGNYNVTLGFYEPAKNATVGSRVFGVKANGADVIQGLDLVASTGKYRVATTRTFPVAVTNGKLNLAFVPVVGGAVVSNITVVKQ